MELTSPQLNTLKISSKKGYILVDPQTSDEAKIVILSDGFDKEINQTEDNLVIYGPGDFEASGILIKGTRPETETMYSVDTAGEGRVLLVSSNSLSKLADEDDYNVVVVKAVDEVSESSLSSLSTNLVVVYGDEKFIPTVLKEKKLSKIMLKNRDEIEGNLVYLEKK